MSTETIFRQLGRLNDSHTGIGPGKTREEYLKLFSRTSYSSQNDWPYSSPFAGYYDVTNTSTSLILLNQRFKFSHLRGHILPREKSRRTEDADQKTFDETIVESEQQHKINHSNKILSPRVSVDPYRHFESQNKYWHNRMCKGSHSVDNATDYSCDSNMTFQSGRPRTASSFHKRQSRSASSHPRSQSAVGTSRKPLNQHQSDPAFAESLCQYYQYISGASQQTKVGLQQSNLKEPTSRRLRQSGIYRNPALTQGQKLYLLAKCHVYDIENARNRHTNSYLQVLNNRFKADLPGCKFGLHDPREFITYAKFIKTPRPTARPLNTGFFTSKKAHQPRIPGENKKQPVRNQSQTRLDLKDFTATSKQSFSKDLSSTRSPQRISASSLPVNDRASVSIRMRHDEKRSPEMTPTSSGSHD